MSVFRQAVVGLGFGNGVGAGLYIGVKCGTWYGLWVGLALLVVYVALGAIDIGKCKARELR